MGDEILKRSFQEALEAFCGSRTTLEQKESLAFVQGTGLDIFLGTFQYALDAEELRRGFFTLCKRV